jgi:hypothetical protein
MTEDQELANLVGGRRGRLIPRVETGTPPETNGKLDEELVRTIVLKTAESVQEMVIGESIEIVEVWRDEVLAGMKPASRPDFEDLVFDLIQRLEGESNE